MSNVASYPFQGPNIACQHLEIADMLSLRFTVTVNFREMFLPVNLGKLSET